nr:right-handed parallel beta-helix repeat-containing protein [Sphingomonas sp. ID1715]
MQAALNNARGGDTIQLAGGNYGEVRLSDRNYSSVVTIQSDPSNAAHFDTLFVERSSSIAFSSVDIGRGLKAGEAEYTKIVTVEDSARISFSSSFIHGSLDGNPSNDGIGLYVNRVDGFSIDDSRFEELFRGTLLQQSSSVAVLRNDYREMRSDGIDVAAVRGVQLDGNSFTNFRPVGSDHADAIQFWNVGQPFGSRDIVIKNNVVLNGSGVGPQGIFMNAANGYGYVNVQIENNLIHGNDAFHGIYIEDGSNVKISGNSTLSEQSDVEYMWIQVQDTTGLTLTNNLAERIIVGSKVGLLANSGNQDFWTNPALSSLVPNLNSPLRASDLIIPGVGYQLATPTPTPTPAPAPAPAPTPTPSPASTPQTLYGTAAPWETLRGSAASETIYGVAATGSNPGKGTRDYLYGGGAADVFVLGDARGLFYDDDLAGSAGRADHALILDFGADDKIQLVGALSDYILNPETINGVLGTSIIRDDNRNGKFDSTDEYVAHVSGSSAALNLTAAAFTFAGSSPAPAPTPTPSPAPPPTTPTLYGTAAPWETIRGTAASEIIHGVAATGSNPGKGTRDYLYGGGGADLFVLGDARGLFYDDDLAGSAGRADHALILDFGADDRIQLVGALSDYILNPETINGVLGTSIIRDDNRNGKFDSTDEYVAHVSGSAAALNLTAADFIFASSISGTAANQVLASAEVLPLVDDSHWLTRSGMMTFDSFVVLC